MIPAHETSVDLEVNTFLTAVPFRPPWLRSGWGDWKPGSHSGHLVAPQFMAGIICAGSRTVGSYSVSNFFFGRTGLSINKSTCYVTTSGFSDLIQALLTWYERDECAPDSHCQSIKRRLCPSPMSLRTDKAVLLLFTGLPVEGNSCRFSHFFGNGRMWSDFRGSCCCRHPSRAAERVRGPNLGCLLRGRTQSRRGPWKREGQDQTEKAKETNFWNPGTWFWLAWRLLACHRSPQLLKGEKMECYLGG